MIYKGFLLAAFVVVWTWAAIKPVFREDWLLENYLVFLFFPLILFLARYFELSNVSYTLIALFGALHVIGSHYTYSLVPFGYTLQHWFGAQRTPIELGPLERSSAGLWGPVWRQKYPRANATWPRERYYVFTTVAKDRKRTVPNSLMEKRVGSPG